MQIDEIKNEVLNKISEYCKIPPESVPMDMVIYKNIDSLDLRYMLFGFEREFKIEISDRELNAIYDVDSLLKLMNYKINGTYCS